MNTNITFYIPCDSGNTKLTHECRFRNTEKFQTYFSQIKAEFCQKVPELFLAVLN